MIPDFRRAAQTDRLIEVLRAASIGETITYRRLSDAIGEDVQSKRHYLNSATHALEVEGVVFRTEINVGVRRISGHDLPAVGQQAIDRTRRTAKRGSRRLGLIDRMNDVDPQTAADVRGKRSLLNLIAWATSGAQRRRIEHEARQSASVVPPATLLDIFKR